MSRRLVPDQDAVGLADPPGAVPRPDRHGNDLPGHVTLRVLISGHSSALLSAYEVGGSGQTKLRGVTRPAAEMGRGHEGDDQRGPQLRDCARMVHKTANVLDKLPRGTQPKAKGMLHDIYQAEGRAKAEKAFDLFVKTFEAKYPKATGCLVKDRDVLLNFYDYPAEHWLHIRTTNPIEKDQTDSTSSDRWCGTPVAGYDRRLRAA